MGDSLEALIAHTQDQLQPLIAKPKLADKLLAKPPFRFLHDVFTAVTQSTGFAKELYNDFELGSANLKDKSQKTAFLDKMIVCVGQCLSKDFDVRSSKIVAGLEPENTNLLLQGLAQVAKDTSLDWNKAVQTALARVSSFTAEGELAPGAAAAALAVEAPPAATLPSSNDRSSSAEAKEKEKSRRESKAESKGGSEGDAAPPRSAEEAHAPLAPCKQSVPKTSHAAPSRSSSTSKNINHDEVLLQSVAKCNGGIERTKTLVEQVITKPKMSPKLLGKPPFRFLHDVISEVTRMTGFAEGLFSGEELDSGAIKEKGPKMDYLTKIILCVGCHLNVEMEAKPAKIVAGLEPEATCKFLQLLTVACKAGSSKEAVQRVLAGDTAVRSFGSIVKKPRSRERTPEIKQPSRSTTPPESKQRTEAVEAKEKPKEAEPGSFSGPKKPLAIGGGDNDDVRFEVKNDDGDDGGARMGTSGAPGTSGTSRTSRPTTARRRPPKLKENVTEVGRLMVPDAKAAPVAGIMKDGDNNDTESEDEAATGDDTSNQPHSALLPGDAGAHGRLVRHILKNQNAEEAARRAKEGEDTAAATANEAETGIRLGRRNKSFKPERMKSSSAAAASSLAEMNALRADIQRLCQAANPVGKSVEFVHEDLDAMSKELEFWRKEYARKRDALADEQKRTEEALQPLQIQLREVEEQVKEQLHKINTLKAAIAKNEEKTQQLLRMVVSA
ncbi:TRAF3-interacting protein, putative [Phytophthora infestans T30-4]|uniref:TRAF3-interacting protein 1 n=1 Tax=Phytophthora infestans (strain T30-4) TaxID=403677 RepID=D0NND1_PHYIT|nr:TRAF3-interacting protein, putative [Phytophthora infestans T30-4]EEY62067.1 TRAF3-interacting protein, putative [Phytophthora infestans T30-4]|eukprot:XP_002899371.1 TRAF3-interacting protein, putative [Phytophthora infestans T30-4]